MRRKFYSLLMLGAMLLPTACEYDDGDLWNKVNDLDERVENLEEAVAKLNNNVTTLSQLMQGKLFIESVEDKGDGLRVVNLVSPDGSTQQIEIRDGKDGAAGPQGDKGDKGDTGATGPQGDKGDKGDDGDTPVVSVKQDSDGNYYWTVNGEYLYDANGQKIRANGLDGKDGNDGADGTDGKDGEKGKNGVAPAFKIENGMWYVSLDRGITWTVLGEARGADGDSFFKDAQQSEDGSLAYLTLADGTVLTFEVYRQFDIVFDVANALVLEGQTKDIAFKVTGMTPKTEVQAIGKKNWDADAKLNSDGTGVLTVTAPSTVGTGSVIVLVSDGAQKTIMRTLTFVSGTVRTSTTSFEVPAAGGSAEVTVETNLDFTVTVPDDAPWIKVIGSRAYEMRTEKFQIAVDPSDNPEPRAALVSLESDGQIVETILVVQDAVAFDATKLVLRVNPAKATNNQVCLPFNGLSVKGGKYYIDWGDGTEVQVINAKSATVTTPETTYPKYTYEDINKEYNVSVWGDISIFNGGSANYTQGIVGIVQWGTGIKYSSVNLQSNPNIVSLPGVKGDEFANLSSAQFRNLSGLKVVSPDLFKGAVKLSTISNLFYKCTELEELPENLFESCTQIRNVQNAFDGCVKLRNIPPMLNTTNFSSPSIIAMCRDCESLVALPEKMWPEEFLQQVTNINSMFSGCTSLETVPDNFFKGLGEGMKNNKKVAVTIAAGMFSNCVNLKHVNIEYLFNVGLIQGYGFGTMFRNCSSLEASVPVYELAVGDQTYTVAPWERPDYISHENSEIQAAARAVFGTRSSFSASECFVGCEKLIGYAEIPSTWGGLNDGISAPPVIKVVPVLPEGKEYYQVDFELYGKDVQELWYYLSTSEGVEQALPKHGNSLERLVREAGNKVYDDNFLKAVNSENGGVLGWEGGMPEFEYEMVVLAINSKGCTVTSAAEKTQPMPRGSDDYEAYVGTWIVTSEGATTEVVAEGVPASTFEVTIVPNRVDENYAVYGWGNSIFNQYPFMWHFNPSTKALEVYNGSKGATNVIQNYPFGPNDDPDALFSNYNVIYHGYVEDPNTHNLGFWSSMTSECLFAGKYIKSADKVTLTGQRSASASSAEYGDAYWVGMEVALAMGTYGYSQLWTPVGIIRPDKRYVYEGKELTPFHYAPYTMVRKSDAAKAPEAFTKAARQECFKASVSTSGASDEAVEEKYVHYAPHMLTARKPVVR